MTATQPMPPARINACRGIATWILRAVSVVLMTLGAYLILKRTFFFLGTGDAQTAFTSFMEIGEGHSLYRGLAMLAIGAALAFSSKAIARWILPPPPEGCPRCGYEKVEQDRCPECGLTGFAPPRAG